MATNVLWFRRDLRLHDNPALLAARDAAGSGGVLPLFVLDDALRTPSGAARLAPAGCARTTARRSGSTRRFFRAWRAHGWRGPAEPPDLPATSRLSVT